MGRTFEIFICITKATQSFYILRYVVLGLKVFEGKSLNFESLNLEKKT